METTESKELEGKGNRAFKDVSLICNVYGYTYYNKYIKNSKNYCISQKNRV